MSDIDIAICSTRRRPDVPQTSFHPIKGGLQMAALILQLNGFTVEQIAGYLRVCPRTVKNYTARARAIFDEPQPKAIETQLREIRKGTHRN